ncbi:MAG: NTP transferase domain-containing protein, partial [Candidatus Heimdallarchaeota archaeon]|nr:NTP transferase domain-containing protein [Candidatus Heimdallarchaeota archaeon]
MWDWTFTYLQVQQRTTKIILLLEKAGVSSKSLIPLNSRPMIHYVLDALTESKRVESVTIFGLTEEELNYKMNKPIEYLEAGVSLFDTTMKACKYFLEKENPPEYILNVSADLPLITGEMIDRLIDNVNLDGKIGLFYNIVRKSDRIRPFPNVKKVAFKLRSGAI